MLESDINWKLVKNVSRNTVNKDHTNKAATSKFKLAILISEHSPIREIKIRWKWENIKSWIAVHFSRHKYECYVSTQRTDRTGVDRDALPQGQLVNMDNSANAQNLIDMARKRLCYQASTETREYMESLKLSILNSGQDELFEVLVPNCIYRAGCPEFTNCGYYNRMMNEKFDVTSINISERYVAYNDMFINEKRGK
jgi:hypothetical protein